MIVKKGVYNMDKEILNALYYIRKNQILQFYKLNPEKSGYSNSYIYAITNDCYPFFHSTEETDIYLDCFSISKDFCQRFIKFIDEECWIKKEYKTFYQLENIFGRDKRYDMIIILRYCYLDNRFSEDKFWNTITRDGECPIECKSIASEFSEWEIY